MANVDQANIRSWNQPVLSKSIAHETSHWWSSNPWL